MTENEKNTIKKITVAGLKNDFDAYLKKCNGPDDEPAEKEVASKIKKKTKIPTIKDFWCVYMEQPWTAWNEMLEDKATAATCRAIRDTLEGIVLDALINGQGNSTGLIFDLKANYGYTDKQLAGDNLQLRKIEINVRRND